MTCIKTGLIVAPEKILLCSVSGVAANFTPDGHLISGDGTHLHTPAGIELLMRLTNE